MIFKLIDFKELIDFSVESYEGSMFQYRDFVPFVIAILIYWTSYLGYKQSQTVNSTKFNVDPIDDKDYSKTAQQLVHIMEEEHLFLDPVLSLNTLSSKTQLSEKEISTTLNKHLNKNFYNFVNEYRVNEVKQRLLDPKFKDLKIISIAYDCGFNSKPTFNRIFKEYTGKSPNAFRINS
jgi:AraC-like DNA-binding protein